MSRPRPFHDLIDEPTTVAADHRWACIICAGPTTATWEVCPACDVWLHSLHPDTPPSPFDHTAQRAAQREADLLMVAHLAKLLEAATPCTPETNSTTMT